MSNRKPYRPFRNLCPETADFLEKRQATPVSVPKEFANYVGAKGLISIQSWEWQLHHRQQVVAHCRMVRIHGAATDIVNSMFFSAYPQLLPSFTAEFLTFGQSPKLVFVDLQVPGASVECSARTAEALFPVQAKHSNLPDPGNPPDWAIAYSAGGYLFTRPNEQSYGPQLCELYHDYLNAWGMLIDELPEELPEPSSLALAELDAFKREHVEHTPGNKFLGQCFGYDWKDHFFNSFLYR